jgi:hypothetical protein
MMITLEEMTIDGVIVNVMESWPLQLTVDADAKSYNVLLQLNTIIEHEGREVSERELKPGLQVMIRGYRSPEEFAMTAKQIEIH